jgi:hypothetical protein
VGSKLNGLITKRYDPFESSTLPPTYHTEDSTVSFVDNSGFDNEFEKLTVNDVEHSPLRNDLLEDEKSEIFNTAKDHFNDNCDPRRERFCVRTFSDINKRKKQYRNIQLACNMHRCTFTCWKYDKTRKRCRFCFPRDIVIASRSNNHVRNTDKVRRKAFIQHGRDRKLRPKTTVLPESNNVNFNPHIASELYICAQGCNTDAQYIANKRGAAEYTTSYTMKAEAPDSDAMLKFLAKFCDMKQSKDEPIKTQEWYKIVCNALLSSSPVSTTHALWVLLGFPFVMKSRTVTSINTLPKAKINGVILCDPSTLQNMSSSDSVICKGPNTQLGRRLSYEALVKYMFLTFNECHVTYFTFLTCFRCEILNESKHVLIKELSESLKPEKSSCIIIPTADTKRGFRVQHYIYKYYKTPIIIHLSPYFRLNAEDEHYAFSTLLLHMVWGTSSENVGEQYLLRIPDCDDCNSSAVKKLQYVMNCNDPKYTFPDYFKGMTESIQHSQDMLDEVHINNTSNEYDEDNEEQYCRSVVSDDSNNSNEDPDLCDFICTDSEFIESSELRNAPCYSSELHIHQIQSLESKRLLKQFVSNIQKSFLESYRLENCIGNTCNMVPYTGHQYIVQYPNHMQLKTEYEIGYNSCSNKQKLCLDRIKHALTSCKSTAPREQLIMFISGPGGTGKSYIIKLTQILAKLEVGKTKGIYGPFLTLALTGSAANNIGGFTVQSAFNMGRTKVIKIKPTDDVSKTVGGKLDGTEILLIDEVSLFCLDMLTKLHEYCKAARLAMPTVDSIQSERNLYLATLPFGGFHVMLCGDFYQLPPVMGIPLFMNANPLSVISQTGKRLWEKVNFFMNLEDNFRFSHAEQSLLARFLVGIIYLYNYDLCNLFLFRC